jgi:putative hydrolase of HD superfamily
MFALTVISIALHLTMSNSLLPSPSSASRAIDFLTMARGLKTTKRTGWVMREVPEPESVADHSWRISLMAMVASFSDNVNTDKCIKMALVHDLAEAAVGDITPHCGVSDSDKHQLELDAITKMTNMLGDSMGSEEILGLWKEYEDGTTEEAKLVKDMDKLEMILQAQEYEMDGANGKSLDQFFASTRGKWKTDIGESWAKEIESRRNLNAVKHEEK